MGSTKSIIKDPILGIQVKGTYNYTGDLTLTAGDLTLTSGDITVSSGSISLTASDSDETMFTSAATADGITRHIFSNGTANENFEIQADYSTSANLFKLNGTTGGSGANVFTVDRTNSTFQFGSSYREAHIADATGGSTIDAEARTAVNAVIAALEAFGITATS